MSQGSLNTLSKAAESLVAWNDQTRIAFDKRYVEAIERTIEAYEDALAELQRSIQDAQRTLDGLDTL